MNTEKPARPWKEITEDLAKEKDPERVQELIEELGQALAEQFPKAD